MLAEDELKSLMLAALDGDALAYRRLLEDVRWRLRRFYGRRLGRDPGEQEDLVQETLMAIHVKRATFDRSQRVGAWVYAIARYKLIDHYRRTGRRRQVPLEDAGDVFGPDESAASEARQDIGRGLDTLPAKTRDLVRSVKLNDESVADVAARTGMSESAVKVAVHRGFIKLAARLRGDAARGDGR